MTTDYVLIEGDLVEITDYTYNDPDDRYDDAHGNWLFAIKNDHVDDHSLCMFCSMVGEETKAFFTRESRRRERIAKAFHRPIYVDGKKI